MYGYGIRSTSNRHETNKPHGHTAAPRSMVIRDNGGRFPVLRKLEKGESRGAERISATDCQPSASMSERAWRRPRLNTKVVACACVQKDREQLSWANTRLAGRVHDAARVVLCLPSAASVLSVCVWRPCPLPSLARVLPPQRVGEKQSDTTSCQASPWIPGVNRLGPMSTIGTCH